MIDILIFLVSYAIFIFLISLFINGVKISASGETVILPDGSEKDSEMILYPLAKYLTQKTTKIIYYTDASELEKLIKKVNSFGRGMLLFGMRSQFDKERYENIMVTDGKVGELRQVLGMLDPSIVVEENQLPNSVSMYREIEVYRFSKYIRKPIIQCIICMSSFWGSVAYWGSFLVADRLVCYGFFDVELFSAFMVLWVPTIFILSYVNYLIYKHK